jgi:enoyl-[acyl-carrier protein] reductase I
MTRLSANQRGQGMPLSSLMKGKRGLVMGVANNHSIAWGIAMALHKAGAELAFSYQGDLFRKRVAPLVESLKPAALIDCDVSKPESIDAAFAELGKVWSSMDFLVHAIAFSDKEQLKGRYVDTTAENFRMTMDISCYSFTAVAQRAEKMMGHGGSMVTLTYAGSERVMPHYNVMGVAKAALEASVRYMAEDMGKQKIRVNAISAGPIKTLAFAGIADSRYILKWNEYNSPLRRTVTQSEVGNAALFLLSDLGTAVTGETMHVDAGYHVVGMKAEDAPDINVVQKSDATA